MAQTFDQIVDAFKQSHSGTHIPPPPSADYETMREEANEVGGQWGYYDNWKKPEGIAGWFAKPPDPPKVDRPPDPAHYAGGDTDPEYRRALAEWWNKKHANDNFIASGFDDFGSRTESFSALQHAAYNDLMNMRETEELNRRDRIAVAEAFGTERDRVIQEGRDRIEAAFGTRNQEIDAARDRVRGDVRGMQDRAATNAAMIRQAAERSYADVMAKFEQINAELTAGKLENLAQLRNDVAKQMETVSGSVRDAAMAQVQETVAQYQAMGYDLNSPQVAAAVGQVTSRARESIGRMASEAWTGFNRLRSEALQKWGELKTAFGSSALSTLQQAGTSLTAAYESAGRIQLDADVEANRIIAETEKWAESEKTQIAYQKGQLHAALDTLELAGLEVEANLLFSAVQRTWVPELPFLQALYDTKYRDDQTDFQNFMGIVSTVINVGSFLGTWMGKGGFDAPKSSSSSGGIFGSIFSGIGSIFGGVGSAIGGAAGSAADRAVS